MNGQGNDFVSKLTQAARDNPLAATLIGGGALWLVLGNRAIAGATTGMAAGVSGATAATAQGLSRAAETVTETGARAFDRATDGARTVGEAAASGVEALKQRLGAVADSAGATLSQTVRAAPDPSPSVAKAYGSAQSALADLLERQPLVLGAIGLAIGAGVAGAIASTAIENELAGPISDEVKGLVKERTEGITKAAQRAAGEIGDDFRNAASDTAGKLREAGAKAAESFATTTG